jgi:hypothetical protein
MNVPKVHKAHYTASPSLCQVTYFPMTVPHFIKVDDEILRKARDLANQRNTSINAIVRQTLEDFVTKDRNRKAALEGLESLWQKTEARIGKKKWTRDELHET